MAGSRKSEPAPVTGNKLSDKSEQVLCEILGFFRRLKMSIVNNSRTELR